MVQLVGYRRLVLVPAEVVHAGHSLVSNIIDPDQTEDGMIVAYGVCQQLDEMKHTYHGLPDFLTKVGLADANDIDSYKSEQVNCECTGHCNSGQGATFDVASIQIVTFAYGQIKSLGQSANGH